ncbi:hypothetical protein CFP56_018161, partial [Quercus suber]
PCHSPKVETRTHKNFSSSLASSGPSLVNNTHLSDMYGGAISSIVTQQRRRASRNVTHFPILSQTSRLKAARNERDEAHAREVEARELLRIAKHNAEKTKLTLQIAEDKVYKYRIALFLSWTVLGVYFVFSNVFGGHGHTQLRLP